MAYQSRKKSGSSSQGLLGFFRGLKPTLTFPALRGMLRLPSLPPGLEISLALNQKDLESCYQVLHDVYVEMGFMDPHPAKIRVNVFNMLPHTTTIMARINGEVVGTISVVRDNPLGLPLDESIDTTQYRKPGWQVAEVTGLAVKAPWRGQGQILFPLLKYVYEYAVRYLKADVFQIATALTKEDFFRGILFFEPISESVFRDPLINGTEVTALYLELNSAKTLFKRAYGNRGPQGNLFTYFTGLELPNFKFPERALHQVCDPSQTAVSFEYFFKERTNLMERLSDREVFALRDIYRDSPVIEFLREPNSLPPYPARRSAQRFVVSCSALLEGEQGDEPVLLLDVSESGFRMYSKMPQRLREICHFRVQLADNLTLPVTARPIWNRRGREWGFTLVESPKGWKEFLHHLESQLFGPSARKKAA